MNRLLKEGDIIELVNGHTVYANVPEHFVYSNRKGSFKLTHHEVRIGGEFEYLAGHYLVCRTTLDGGGIGHGQHDVYPDGHHVFCERLDDRSIKVDFYQTGCFTAVIGNIDPIRSAQTFEQLRDANTIGEMKAEVLRMTYHDIMVKNVTALAGRLAMNEEDRYAALSYYALRSLQEARQRLLDDAVIRSPAPVSVSGE